MGTFRDRRSSGRRELLLMKIHLTAEERANVIAEAARRGVTVADLVVLLVAARKGQAQRPALKSNGWSAQRETFLGKDGQPVAEPLPLLPSSRGRPRIKEE